MKNALHGGRLYPLVFLLVLLVCIHCKSSQDAEPSNQASERHARGVSLRDEGEWCKALKEFEKAAELSEKPGKYRSDIEEAKKKCIEAEQVVPETPKEIVGKDGALMDLVPAGAFIMGSPEGVGRDDEHPKHEVWLDDFYIDRYEVTVERFEKCVKAGACSEEHFRSGDEDPTCNFAIPERRNHPINCVNWFGMKEYCAWAGKRLPTEAEWEKAARGVDERLFPWGDQEPTCERAVMFSCREEDVFPCTSPVGRTPSGVGPYGTHNLAANVTEWCFDLYDETAYSNNSHINPINRAGDMRVHRGGSCSSSEWALKSAMRDKTKPTLIHYVFGGRCAKAP